MAVPPRRIIVTQGRPPTAGDWRVLHERPGLTLVELLVVLVIVSLLSSLTLSGLLVARTSAKIAHRSAKPQRITQTSASSRKPIPDTGLPSQRLPWKKFQPARTSTVTSNAKKSASKVQ